MVGQTKLRGLAFGYHANAKKNWLLIKEEHITNTKDIFHDTQVNISSHGKPHLGAALGSAVFTTEFVSVKVAQLNEELSLLVEVARVHPHAAYAACVHGCIHKWSFLCRVNVTSVISYTHRRILSGKGYPKFTDRDV